MKEFCLSDYNDSGNRRFAMLCSTAQGASIFLRFLNENGRRWHSGEVYREGDTHFSDYRDGILYFFNEGRRGSCIHISEELTLLCFDDFDWSKYGYNTCAAQPMSFEEMFYGTTNVQASV